MALLSSNRDRRSTKFPSAELALLNGLLNLCWRRHSSWHIHSRVAINASLYGVTGACPDCQCYKRCFGPVLFKCPSDRHDPRLPTEQSVTCAHSSFTVERERTNNSNMNMNQYASILRVSPSSANRLSNSGGKVNNSGWSPDTRAKCRTASSTPRMVRISEFIFKASRMHSICSLTMDEVQNRSL